ncbi:MAG: ATP-binding protein [Eubacteriales bacterium]|nr:ATP-binding protein [Eubacteriales bacterium]
MKYLQMLWDMLISLVAAGFICRSLGYLLTVKNKRQPRFILYAVCWLLGNTVVYIGDLANLPPTLAVFLALVWLTCEGSSLKKLTIGLMLASTVFAYNTLLDNFFRRIWEPVFLYGRLFFALCLFLETKFLAPAKGYELSAKMWRLLLVLTIPPAGIVLSVVLLSDIDRASVEVAEKYIMILNNRISISQAMYVALLLLTLFSFFGLLWTVTVLAKQRKLEQQSMFAEINQNYYEAMEQQHSEIRRLKHDLANHLQTLVVLPEEKKEAYLQELLQNSSVTQTLNYCGDPTVNAVLTVKESLMQREGISFHRRLEIPQELPLEKTDICALFANALDNAIEAAGKLPPEKREIFMESYAQKGLLVVSVKNPCTEQAGAGRTDTEQTEDAQINHTLSLPRTTKADRQNHGIGLQSIQEIVRRHDGDMEIRREDHVFELFLYLSTGKQE